MEGLSSLGRFSDMCICSGCHWNKELHNSAQCIQSVTHTFHLYTHMQRQIHSKDRCVHLRCIPLYHPGDRPTRPAAFEKETYAKLKGTNCDLLMQRKIAAVGTKARNGYLTSSSLSSLYSSGHIVWRISSEWPFSMRSSFISSDGSS